MWRWLRRVFGGGRRAAQIAEDKPAVKGSTAFSDSQVRTASGSVHVTIHSGDLGRQQELNISSLDEFARKLLLAATASEHGVIQLVGHGAGLTVLANGTPLPTDGSPHAGARLESALQELERWGLIEARGAKTGIFCVTLDGYRIASLIRDRKPAGG